MLIFLLLLSEAPSFTLTLETKPSLMCRNKTGNLNEGNLDL